MIVYITRHGQPFFGSDEDFAEQEFPRGDRGLSELGRLQATRLGKRLARMGFDGVTYSSPYRRTAETTDLIAAQIPGVTFRPEPAIREIARRPERLRALPGMTLDEMRATFSRVAADAALPHPWWTTDEEDDDKVLARAKPFFDRLMQDGETDVLLVGHGASVVAATRYFFALAPQVEHPPSAIWNCSLTAVRVKPDPEILLVRDTAHLGADQVTTNQKSRAQWEAEQEAVET